MRDIARNDLVILNEFGYVPLDLDSARLLFQGVSDCYERHSLVITTNIEFSKWGTVLGDDKMAAAMIDRIVHHGRLVEFTGASHRMEATLMLGKAVGWVNAACLPKCSIWSRHNVQFVVDTNSGSRVWQPRGPSGRRGTEKSQGSASLSAPTSPPCSSRRARAALTLRAPASLSSVLHALVDCCALHRFDLRAKGVRHLCRPRVLLPFRELDLRRLVAMSLTVHVSCFQIAAGTTRRPPSYSIRAA